MDSTSHKIQIDRLLYTHYQHQNLAAVHKFYTDFGFQVAEQEESIIYYRGFGENPCIYVAEASPDNSKHFVLGAWLVASSDDLKVASRLPGASAIKSSPAPGGGDCVDVIDPNGITIRLIHGVNFRLKSEQKNEIPKEVVFNDWRQKPRRGEFQRFSTGPSKVHKLGHYGLLVDKSKFDETVTWYLENFSLARTDLLYDAKSGRDMMVFMHIDKGKDFTDHHSFFILTSPSPVPKIYPHHSSFEVDHMDSQLMGHYHLQDRGWTNCWGVGRHLLGSQIFDYWFDPSGNIVEHYSDGDLVNEETEVGREVAVPETMAVWGPNVTLAFLTASITDIGKEVPKPTAAHSAVEA